MGADYDVGILALTTPPASAVLTPYRPAVSVRNYGIHDALASGILRIYSAGRLIFTTELYSATIPPGETRDALGTDYWTPPAEGHYEIIADVSCPLDQVEQNNHLGPTPIDVTGEPPPPPTPVAPHASQHEDGGADEVIVDGLHGLLAEAQTPKAHKDSHAAGGSDELNLSGLHGVLADGQPIADHHETHEDGGSDELNVDDLHGVLYNKQKPETHGNEAHDPNFAGKPHGNESHDPDMATTTQLQNHLDDTTDVHAVATNLEQTTNKGKASGYAGLGANKLVPIGQLAPADPVPPAEYVLRSDQTWGPSAAAVHHTTHQVGGSDEINVAGLSGKLTDAQDPVGHHSTHEPGGSDPVSGIPSFPSPHAATHQNGGADEITVAGLSGKLADAQDPTSHGNAAHTSAFEDSAHKGQANGYAPLGEDALVPSEFLPTPIPGGNALFTKLAIHTPQLIDSTGDHLVLGALNTGTDIKPNWSMHVIITGWIDPHETNTFLQLMGNLSQGITETWICSNTVAVANSVLGQFFKYDARLHFRSDSLSSFSELAVPDTQDRSCDNGILWDVLTAASWRWYVHLGIPTLTIHILSRQCILEPYTP
jgi:hypothetical protein